MDVRLRRWSITTVAAALPAVVALLALPLRSALRGADVAAALVGAVALAGTLGGRAAPLLAATSAAGAYDLLWTRPYGSLDVRDPGDILTGFLLLVVGFFVAEACRRKRRPSATPDTLRAVSRVAEDIAGGDAAGIVVLDVARSLVDLLGLDDCWFEVPPFDHVPARPELVHTGELTEQGVTWDPALVGFPGTGFLLPVVARNRVAGRFVCIPRRSRKPSRASVLVALTLADQAASAMLLATA